MLRDIATKYVEEWPDKKTYNCAEATLRAANDYYHLGLEEDILKMAVAFGGGMFSEETCGIVTAGCAALARRYAADEAPHINEKVKQTTIAWIEAVKEQYGTVSCAGLKEKCGCNCKMLVQEACGIFERVNG